MTAAVTHQAAGWQPDEARRRSHGAADFRLDRPGAGPGAAASRSVLRRGRRHGTPIRVQVFESLTPPVAHAMRFEVSFQSLAVQLKC